jgi:hypothetical protein
MSITPKTEHGPQHMSQPVRRGQITFTNSMLVVLVVLEIIRFFYGF